MIGVYGSKIFPISICLLNQPSTSQLLGWSEDQGDQRPAQLVPGNFRRNAQICNMAIFFRYTPQKFATFETFQTRSQHGN